MDVRTSWVLVDPVDGYPLMLSAQFLYGSAQFIVRLVHVVINEHLVEVLLVLALDAPALIERTNKVLLLQPHRPNTVTLRGKLMY